MDWVKSSKSSTGNCVEAVGAGLWVLVRNSRDPGGTVLELPRTAWHAFLDAIRAGELDDL